MEKYRSIEELVRGSYGVVWKALNQQTGEVVAVKKLMDRMYYSLEECKNLTEVKALFKMNNHPNIIKLKEIDKEKDTLYLVFEYMECSLLKRMKNQKKSFSEAEIRDLCFQLFQGLAHIHHSGYIHRDIKPENLLVSKDVIKIGGFGQACETNGQLPYTDCVTARWYTAPEVLLCSGVYDYAVDMWAMGAIMAELFRLQPLFGGSCEIQLMHNICKVLGTPTESIWSAGLELASDFDYKFPLSYGVQFSALLPNASPDAVNMIAALLSWNPCMRPTAMEALHHPFFDCCYHVPRAVRHEPVGASSVFTADIVFKFGDAKRDHEAGKITARLQFCEDDSERADPIEVLRMLPENLFDF